jgi:hypothetical protein
MIESHLDVGGAVAFWTLAEWSDRDRLRQEFRALGLESFVPEPRPASSALRDALDEVLGGPRVLVRPLAAKDGFAVVREDRGSDRNSYSTCLVARVTDDAFPHPAFDPWDHPHVRTVRDAFRTQLGRLPAVQLSAALVRVVDALGGTRLRPSGAVYWIPGPKLDEWARVGRAVEVAADGGASAVYLLRHRLDADAVRAVRDAVVAEVQGEAERIRTEVAAGQLGGRALETRQGQAADLRAKVLLYEDLLNVGLAGLHQAVDAADQAAATAALLLSARSAEAVPARAVG